MGILSSLTINFGIEHALFYTCRLIFVVLTKLEHLRQMTWYACIMLLSFIILICSVFFSHYVIPSFLALSQEFSGVVGSNNSTDLESDTTKLPARTVEILASCHALVFVDNKLVCFIGPVLSCEPCHTSVVFILILNVIFVYLDRYQVKY